MDNKVLLFRIIQWCLDVLGNPGNGGQCYRKPLLDYWREPRPRVYICILLLCQISLFFTSKHQQPICSTLPGTNIPAGTVEDDFPFPKMGYVNPGKGICMNIFI